MAISDPQKERLKSINYADMPIMPMYSREDEEQYRRMCPPLGNEVERYIMELDEKVKRMTHRLEEMEKAIVWESARRTADAKSISDMTKLLKESNEALAAYRKAFEE